MAEDCDVVVVAGDVTVVIQNDPGTLVVNTTSTTTVVSPDVTTTIVESPQVIILEANGGSGPAGPPGPPGPGTSTPATASENISAFQLVALNGSGQAYLPSSAVPADAPRVLGFAATSALTGETFQVITTGIIDTPAVWTPGPQYLGTTPGTLSSTPPSAPDFELWVATAATSSRLIVNVQFPIILI